MLGKSAAARCERRMTSMAKTLLSYHFWAIEEYPSRAAEMKRASLACEWLAQHADERRWRKISKHIVKELQDALAQDKPKYIPWHTMTQAKVEEKRSRLPVIDAIATAMRPISEWIDYQTSLILWEETHLNKDGKFTTWTRPPDRII